MTAPPALLDSAFPPPAAPRRPGVVGLVLGAAAAVVAAGVAVLFAAALALVALLALVLGLMTFLVWRLRGGRGVRPVITARWDRVRVGRTRRLRRAAWT